MPRFKVSFGASGVPYETTLDTWDHQVGINGSLSPTENWRHGYITEGSVLGTAETQVDLDVTGRLTTNVSNSDGGFVNWSGPKMSVNVEVLSGHDYTIDATSFVEITRENGGGYMRWMYDIAPEWHTIHISEDNPVIMESGPSTLLSGTIPQRENSQCSYTSVFYYWVKHCLLYTSPSPRDRG